MNSFLSRLRSPSYKKFQVILALIFLNCNSHFLKLLLWFVLVPAFAVGITDYSPKYIRKQLLPSPYITVQ